MTYPFVLLIYLATFYFQEPAAGIYIIHNPPKKTACDNERRMIIGKVKVCLSKKPIIALSQIKYATDIQYDPKYETHYIDVGLTPAGLQTLTTAVNSFPETKFALAVDDNVICIFSVHPDPDVMIRSIRIGEDAPAEDLQNIHMALKKVQF